ncbi:MAG: DUF547 domain-containing protein [Bacteroidota bacterium]
MKPIVFFISLFFFLQLPAQKSYGIGDVVANFTATTVLNHSATSTNLKGLQSKLTVLDFFGTWCVPCIKALPHLKNLQQQFRNQLSIALISVESGEKLSAFVKKQNNFSFPVIVDEAEKISILFQPPSYPYTVVLNQAGMIVAVTDAAAITPLKIQDWLNQNKEAIPVEKYSALANTETKQMAVTNQSYNNQLVQLSQNFVYAAKTNEPTELLVAAIKNISFDTLQKKLATDAEKKAFWINLYNGFTQVLLKKEPEKYNSRSSFFTGKQIEIGGQLLSLDDVEHGLLRRSKIKWSRGLLNKIFVGSWEKKLRVDTLDYRIHFALNCGAKSCPPIAFYKAAKIDEQLWLAEKAYLQSEVEYDAAKNELKLPKILSWFRADFGGKKGMVEIIKAAGVKINRPHPKIIFKQYDWTLFLNNYTKTNQ